MNKGKLNKVTINQNTINIELHLSNQTDIQEVEQQWLELQGRSTCHFFLTWDWIGPWIKQTKGPFYILKALRLGRVVALAFIFEKKRKSLGFYPVNQWWLNRTGDEQYDQSWIEYNDFLIDQAFESDVRSSLIEFISKQPLWDEFIVGMMSNETEKALHKLPCSVRYLIEDSGCQVNLKDINISYNSEVLSRNTRQKINQTQRLLAKQGRVNFNIITSQKEKLKALNCVGAFHIEKWKNTSTPSGFENPTFLKCFEAQLQGDNSEVSELTLNDKPIGYLINYLYKGRVYFYLSAFSNEFEGKIKLGLYLHSLTIEHYRSRDFTQYDFLAGQSRYKESLSNSSYMHNMCCYYKNNLFFVVENQLKKLKESLAN